MATGLLLETDRDYPTSDGKPMAETELHRKVIVDLIDILQHRYRDRPDVCVSGDLMMFYKRGDPKKHVAPDVFVVFDVENRLRENYLIWQEGKGPDFIIEVTSKSTQKVDQTKKRVLYRDVLRVPEYFQFDPCAEYLRPPLQGFRRVEDEYVPIALENGGLTSEVLGVRLVREGTSLRLFDLATGERLPTRAEFEANRAEFEAQRAQGATERAQREAERAQREAKARREADKRAQREAKARREAEKLASSANERAHAIEAERDRLLAELERLKRS